jgi:hypothetical protein
MMTPSLHVDYLLHFGGTAKIDQYGYCYSRVLVDIYSYQLNCYHPNRYVMKRMMPAICMQPFEEHNELWSSTCGYRWDNEYGHHVVREREYGACGRCIRQHHVILTLLGLKRE